MGPLWLVAGLPPQATQYPVQCPVFQVPKYGLGKWLTPVSEIGV